MIKIIIDLYHSQSPPKGAIVATSPRSYVDCRRDLRRALNNGTGLTLYVTNTLVAEWLRDFATYEGVQWVQFDPVAEYRRLFDSDPAPPFTSELLMAINIATIRRPPPGQVIEPASWILGECLDPVWAEVNPGPAHLSNLLYWIFEHSIQATPSDNQLIQYCLSNWAKVEPAYAMLRAGSIQHDAVTIIRRIALRHYDEIWLYERGLAGKIDMPLKLDAKYWISALRDLEPEIWEYWRERISGIDQERLKQIINQMSGWSTSELHVLKDVLSHHPEMITNAIIQHIRQRFIGIDALRETIHDLETLLLPETPVVPDENWDDQRWLTWAIDEYMPYFAWLIRNNQSRVHQQACVQVYETWLLRRYPAWLAENDSPLVTKQFSYLLDLLDQEPNSLVVWLIIDNMAWWHARFLDEFCQDQNLHLQKLQCGISMVPSITAISKRALATGIAVSEMPKTSISQCAQEKLQILGIRSCIVNNKDQALRYAHDSNIYQCIIWFDNFLDIIAHDRKDFPDDSVVKGYFRDLSIYLGKMHSVALAQGRAFHVLIGSDHGSTLLPPDAPVLSLPRAAVEVSDIWDDLNEQSYTATVSGRAALLKESLGCSHERLDKWYYLEKATYHLPQDYIVPRGYAAVARKPRGWCHGGLTPEETIVPLMHLTPQPIEVKALGVTIQGQIRVRLPSSLNVVIHNPNPIPCERLKIHIADLDPFSIDLVEANSERNYAINVPARNFTDVIWRVQWKLTGEFLRRQYNQCGEAEIPVRRLQDQGSLDDFFG